jgi:hypothetical protein
MKLTHVLAIAIAATGCDRLLAQNDTTDVTGTYVGNATYTIALASGSSSAGAGEATIDLEATQLGVAADVGAACSITASAIETLSISDYTDDSRFVLSSDSIDPSQSCTLPDGTAITVATCDLVVDRGWTLMLDVGGAVGSDGYAVFHFEGAQ